MYNIIKNLLWKLPKVSAHSKNSKNKIEVMRNRKLTINNIKRIGCEPFVVRQHHAISGVGRSNRRPALGCRRLRVWARTERPESDGGGKDKFARESTQWAPRMAIGPPTIDVIALPVCTCTCIQSPSLRIVHLSPGVHCIHYFARHLGHGTEKFYFGGRPDEAQRTNCWELGREVNLFSWRTLI